MVVPDSGFITFNQQNISRDWKYREQIGYMPQIGRYPENMSIAQILEMMKDIRKKKSADLDEELIENFELNKIMDKRMRTLSGGTRQKVDWGDQGGPRPGPCTLTIRVRILMSKAPLGNNALR